MNMIKSLLSIIFLMTLTAVQGQPPQVMGCSYKSHAPVFYSLNETGSGYDLRYVPLEAQPGGAIHPRRRNLLLCDE